jgi:hypothetical protein
VGYRRGEGGIVLGYLKVRATGQLYYLGLCGIFLIFQGHITLSMLPRYFIYPAEQVGCVSGTSKHRCGYLPGTTCGVGV